MKILLTAEQIQTRVRELASSIERDYGSTPITIVGVLTGSLIFVADLVRLLNMPIRIGFVRASSYRGEATTPGTLEVQPDLLPDVKGKDVLLIDDILDTGRTLEHLVGHLTSLDVNSLKVGVLLWKKARTLVPIEPDYVGFEIPDKFVVGYGLDFNDEFRNLPYVGELSERT
ncbi:MAG: hypoxanthine phosphoribosyltransferase [Gemmataceae bacterium]